jgi:hypothetical protein
MSRYGIQTASKSARVIPVREIPVKRTLKQRFKDWLNNDHDDNNIMLQDNYGPELHDEASLRFNVYRATGGMVIETRKYDRIKDVNHTRLHIVVDGDDLGASISKIITMEALR